MVVHNLDDKSVEEAVRLAGRERLLWAFFEEARVRAIDNKELGKIIGWAVKPYIEDGSLWVAMESYNNDGDRFMLIEFLQTISDSEFSKVIMKLDDSLRNRAVANKLLNK